MDDEQRTAFANAASNETVERNTSFAADATPTVISSHVLGAESNAARPKRRIIQKCVLVWVDPCFDQATDNHQDIITEMEYIFSSVNTFLDSNSCIDFFEKIVNDDIFLIVSICQSQQLIPLVHEMSQIEVIYVYGSETPMTFGKWSKVRGMYSQLSLVCDDLKRDVKQCNRNYIPISFLPSSDGSRNQNLDELDPSFMYTQILKEILLNNEYDQKSMEDLVAHCRQQYVANRSTLGIIDEFEHEYCKQLSIQWYTRPCFIYDMVNRALRNLEADTIIKMGFFISDLHRYLEQLYSEQRDKFKEQSQIVYRGQGLSEEHFKQLCETKGGLISFNSFLSTSMSYLVSLAFAESNSGNRNTIGILFKIRIPPSISSSPFARIDNLSYFSDEGEVLFSMHAVFRIGDIQQLADYTRVWKVDLNLTGDKDQQLTTLTKQIRQETFGSTGYERLGKLLMAMGQYQKAEELYQVLMDQLSDMKKKSIFYQQIGDIKDKQNDYAEAITFYKKALEIKENTSPIDYAELGTAYLRISAMYMKLEDFATALSMHDRGVQMLSRIIPSNHPDLVVSYVDNSRTSNQINGPSEALLLQEEALEISHTALPHLSASYNNIGVMYHNTGGLLKALSYYEKALAIFQTTHPPNHPFLATSYNNIGAVYKNWGEYSKALSYYEQSLEIRQKTLPSNHPEFAISYNNIGTLYVAMEEYYKALLYYEKALGHRQKTLHPNSPDIAISYVCIGRLYEDIMEPAQALVSFERAVDIFQRTLPADHPDLQAAQRKIDLLKNS